MTQVPEIFDIEGKQIVVGSLVVFLKDAVGFGKDPQTDIWVHAGTVCMVISVENYKSKITTSAGISAGSYGYVTMAFLAEGPPRVISLEPSRFPSYLMVLK